ncbi:hypothetical protein T11_15471, partial [Trichinella zimbabwensis]
LTLMFKMTTMKSADCLWSHYERYFIQIFVPNYLAISEIKNTCFFLVFWNVQAADTVVLLMSMMIYGKLWSLLCRHLPDQVSMKASPNGRRGVSIFFPFLITIIW